MQKISKRCNYLHTERYREVCIRSWNPASDLHNQITTDLPKNIPWSANIGRGKVRNLPSCDVWRSERSGVCIKTTSTTFPPNRRRWCPQQSRRQLNDWSERTVTQPLARGGIPTLEQSGLGCRVAFRCHISHDTVRFYIIMECFKMYQIFSNYYIVIIIYMLDYLYYK